MGKEGIGFARRDGDEQVRPVVEGLGDCGTGALAVPDCRFDSAGREGHFLSAERTVPPIHAACGAKARAKAPAL